MKRALEAARSECESQQRKTKSVLQQQRQQQEQHQAQLMSLKSERESSNQASIEEMRRHYESQLADQAAERDREVSSMKMRIESFQQQSQSSSQGSDQRLAELQRTISQQEQIIATLREELERLRMSMSQRSTMESSTVVNTAVKRETEYPYLRLVPTYGECVYSNYSVQMRIESFQQQSQSSSQGSDQRLAELQRTISQQEQIIATLREEMERLRMSMSQRSTMQSSTVVNTAAKRETEYPYLRLVPTYGECVYSNCSVLNAGHHGDSRVASEKATKTVRFAESERIF
ncbi:uncharacterized protein LOC116955735 isoform X1 [Petromyzon marinus]|uniref:uncharacterized protein LOC116955735 isoform X1 n=1 Tax=Petromyzon marinus TaxID=7757 RepID=UPI003F7266DE